jgi:hypothetical protein
MNPLASNVLAIRYLDQDRYALYIGPKPRRFNISLLSTVGLACGFAFAGCLIYLSNREKRKEENHRLCNKVRKETIQEITKGKISEDVLVKYIDFIHYTETAKLDQENAIKKKELNDRVRYKIENGVYTDLYDSNR